MAEHVKGHHRLFRTGNPGHDLFSAHGHDHGVRIQPVDEFGRGLRVVHHGNGRAFFYLAFQIFMEQLHFLLEPHDVGQKRLPAQPVGFFIKHDVVPPVRAADGGFHPRDAAADDGDFL